MDFLEQWETLVFFLPFLFSLAAFFFLKNAHL